MPSNALGQAFRNVSEDPGLVLIEIAWRWTFGTIAILVVTMSAFVLLGSVSVDPRRWEAAAAVPPLQLAETVATTLIALRSAILRVSLVAVFALTLCWILMSALGRRATLVRPALSPGASLRTCFVVSIARAVLTLGARVVWILVGIFAGLAGSTRDGVPDPAVILGIALPSLLIIATVWSILNWYFSLAPLFADKPAGGKPATQFAAAMWDFVRSRREELLEISVLTGILRFIAFLGAAMLSFAVSAVIISPRVLLADLVAIALLYFLVGEFLYVLRLAAYATLREQPEVPLDPSPAQLELIPRP